MAKWFDMEEIDKIKNVYSKYTIEDFWEYWSNGESKVMEIRIKDYELVKEVSSLFFLPRSPSGIYVNTPQKLKQVILHVRDKVTVWFGVNPKKKAYNKYGTERYGGKDNNVSEIAHIFIDIDRKEKIGEAKNFELNDIEILADNVLKEFNKVGFAKNYMKLSSANGIQLLLKLDKPIVMPNLEYDQNTKGYISTVEFERKKLMLKESIGKQLIKFTNKFSKELNAEVDISGFNIGRVGGMPFTKNFKFDSFRWRGILEIKNDEKNEGLTDFLLEAAEDIKIYKSSNLLIEKTKLPEEDKIIPGKMAENRVVSILLDYDVSTVNGINDYIWKDIKSLFFESGIIDIDCKPKKEYTEEFFEVHRKIVQKQKRPNFTLNVPDPSIYKFNRDNINKFCRRPDVLIPPRFPLFRKTRPIIETEFPIQIINVEKLPSNISEYKINDEIADITELMYLVYDNINFVRDGWDDDINSIEEVNNINRKSKVQRLYNEFLLGFYNKYGKDVTDYYVKYVFEDYFNRRIR